MPANAAPVVTNETLIEGGLVPRSRYFNMTPSFVTDGGIHERTDISLSYAIKLILNRILPVRDDTGEPPSVRRTEKYKFVVTGAYDEYRTTEKPGYHKGIDFNYQRIKFVGTYSNEKVYQDKAIGQKEVNKKHPEVYSPVTGVVRIYGAQYNTVGIIDKYGYEHQILHMNEQSVETGDIVRAGDRIGRMGNTGAEAQHVHYQIRTEPNGPKINPDDDYWCKNRTTDTWCERFKKRYMELAGDNTQSQDPEENKRLVNERLEKLYGIKDGVEKADKVDCKPEDDADGLDIVPFIPCDPLILDLDGDGVETVGLSAGIHFDHSGDGFRELTGFVGKDDGLLALDRNGDGITNSDISKYD